MSEWINNRDQERPIGWPEDIPLPTIEEAEQAVRNAEKMIIETLDNLRTKAGVPNSDMLNTVIAI